MSELTKKVVKRRISDWDFSSHHKENLDMLNLLHSTTSSSWTARRQTAGILTEECFPLVASVGCSKVQSLACCTLRNEQDIFQGSQVRRGRSPLEEPSRNREGGLKAGLHFSVVSAPYLLTLS